MLSHKIATAMTNHAKVRTETASRECNKNSKMAAIVEQLRHTATSGQNDYSIRLRVVKMTTAKAAK